MFQKLGKVSIYFFKLNTSYNMTFNAHSVYDHLNAYLNAPNVVYIAKFASMSLTLSIAVYIYQNSIPVLLSTPLVILVDVITRMPPPTPREPNADVWVWLWYPCN